MNGAAPRVPLGSKTWTSISRAPIVLIPVGSFEQHGPHLPLDTDTRIAEAIANGAARACEQCEIGPTITVSSSGEHQDFPGTFSIGRELTEQVLIELCRSADWAARVVFVNGHGGNHAAVTSACRILEAEGRPVTSWWPQAAEGDLHAGHVETSVILHLAPHLVNVDAMTAGPTPTLRELQTDGVRTHSPSGVLGDPHGATAEAGRGWLDTWVDELVDHIQTDHR